MESKVKYGQEHGVNLIKIMKKLLSNQNLLKLLVNTDLDPLNHQDIIDPYKEIMNKLIKVVPLMLEEDLTTKSKVVLFYDEGELASENSDNENLILLVNVYCPF